MSGELAARGALEAIEFFGQKWAGTTLEYMPGNALEAGRALTRRGVSRASAC